MDKGRVLTPFQVVSSKESRTELLTWINDLLSSITIAGSHTVLRIQKVEQCGNGVPYILLLPSLLPITYPPLTTKAKIFAKHEFESVVNFKLFADALQKNGIPRPDVLIDEVDKLIKGAYQANLQLLQWFRGLYNALFSKQEEELLYDHHHHDDNNNNDKLKQTWDINRNNTHNLSEFTKLQNNSLTLGTDTNIEQHGVKEHVDSTSVEHTSRNLLSTTGLSTIGNYKDGSSPSTFSTGKTTPLTGIDGGSAICKGEHSVTMELCTSRKTSESTLLNCGNFKIQRQHMHISSTGNRILNTVRNNISRTNSPKLHSTQSVISPLRHSNKRSQSVIVKEKKKTFSSSCELFNNELNHTRLNGTGRSQTMSMTVTSTNSSSRGTILRKNKNNTNTTRPSMDCNNIDIINGGTFTSSTGKQKISHSYRQLVSPHRSNIRQGAPTGLFQPRIIRSPQKLRAESQHTKQRESSVGNSSVSMTIRTVRTERQFFYDKLRQIENLIVPLMESKDVGNETIKLAQAVLDILYSTK